METTLFRCGHNRYGYTSWMMSGPFSNRVCPVCRAVERMNAEAEHFLSMGQNWYRTNVLYHKVYPLGENIMAHGLIKAADIVLEEMD